MSVLSTQYAEVRRATDYIKKNFVIRVQMDGYQFLLQMRDFRDMIHWMDMIQASANIALPIEHRVSNWSGSTITGKFIFVILTSFSFFFLVDM